MKNIVLFGGGLHCNVCIDIVEKSGEYKIIGIIDSKAIVGETLYGYKVIGRQEDIVELIGTYAIDAGVISIGDNYSRKLVRDFVIDKVYNFNFVNVIHPSACIGRNVKLGIGIVMTANVVVNPNCVIKDFCILNTGSQLEHDCYMGKFSQLSVGSIAGAKVTIKKYAAITLGVTIKDRITIGQNTVVGSGSLVLKDLPDNVLAYGSPAKIIRERKSGEKWLD